MCSLQPRRRKEINNRNWCRNLQKWRLFHWKSITGSDPAGWRARNLVGFIKGHPQGWRLCTKKLGYPSYFLGFLDAYYSTRLVNLWISVVWFTLTSQLPSSASPTHGSCIKHWTLTLVEVSWRSVPLPSIFLGGCDEENMGIPSGNLLHSYGIDGHRNSDLSH